MGNRRAEAEGDETNDFPTTIPAGLEGESVSSPQSDDVFHVRCALSLRRAGWKRRGKRFLSFHSPSKVTAMQRSSDSSG